VSVRRALITGISGQDGSYLAELLCEEGLEVHGTLRELSDGATHNLDAVRDVVSFHEGDLLERGTLAAIVAEMAPDEIYHLAPGAHVVVASSREIFGPDAPSPQREDTPCAPGSPYGVAKLAVHQMLGLVRGHDGLHLSSAILFNHESPRRHESFITRKVTAAVAAISLGRRQELLLGDTAAVRDWSAATDIVRGLRLMAAADEPGDYVLASGVGHSVRELVELAFGQVGLDPDRYVRVDPALVRPLEREPVLGDPSRARERLGWSVQTSFEQLIAEMVEADLAALAAAA
jgi:GDPmannose 4,6-dehydratase